MLARMFSGSMLSRRDEKVRVSFMHIDKVSCTPYGSAYAYAYAHACKELIRVDTTHIAHWSAPCCRVVSSWTVTQNTSD